MKKAYFLLTGILLVTWLLGQQTMPPGPPQFAVPQTNAPAPAPASTSTNNSDEMLRALRRAMTNLPDTATADDPQATASQQPAATPAIPSPVAPAQPSGPILLPVPTAGGQNLAIPQPNLQTPIVPAPAPSTGVPTGQVFVPGQAAEPLPVPNLAPPAPREEIIPAGMIQVQGMTLDQFFEIYSMISGRTVLRPYVLQGAPQGITLKAQTDWTREEAVFAMDAVLALNQIAMIPVDGKFVKAVPSGIAPTEGGGISTNLMTKGYTETEQFVTQVAELKTIKPTELATLLASFSKIPNAITPFDYNNTIVIREHASNVKRMLEVIERVDVLRESDYKLEVIPIKYGKVIDLYNTMASLISGQAGGGFQPSTRTQSRAGSGLGTSRLGQASGYGQQQYRQPGQSTLSPQQQTAQPTAGGAQNTFQQRLQQIVSRAAGGGEPVQLLEDARVVPDERSNTLLIYGNKRDMEIITNIVAKVDVLLAQVLIEAVILEVQLGDSSTFGVSTLQNPKRFGGDFQGSGGINSGQNFLQSITNFPGALPSGFSYWGTLGNDIDVAVAAIATDRTANVISRPRIQTSHAIPGTFLVAENVPFISGSYDNYYGGFGGGSFGNRSIVERIDVGISLGVTPFITPDGLVVMEIVQEASQRGADVIIDNNPIPIVNRRTAEATLTVRTGQSIMMGGFITETKSKSKSGVPVLKDIPLLGALFRSKNQSNDRSELIILMRAKVLERPEDAALVAEQEKSELPGIRQMEKDFEKSDKKRREGNKFFRR